MNILICHNDYGKFSGEEHAIETMARVLASHSHNINWLRQSSSEIGNSLTKKASAFFSGIYSFRSRKQIMRLLDENDFDIIQVQNLYPFLSASILPVCMKKGIPIVMRCPNYRLFCPNGLHMVHGKVCERCLGGREWQCIVQNCEDDLFKSIGYSARNAFARITGMIRDNVSIFVVLSEFQKARFINGGIAPERIAILPNIAPSTNVHYNPSSAHLISFVGRVSPEKGINTFLDAARQLPGLRFSVAGHTGEIPGIEELASQNVSFAGFLSGDDLYTFFAKSRILVFPSMWFEGFPNVIATAMASGKPVIASNIGAIAEIVDNGKTGLLVVPGDATDLANKIEYLWERPALCQTMGEAGLQKAKAEYSEERYYSRLMGIYDDARRMTRR